MSTCKDTCPVEVKKAATEDLRNTKKNVPGLKNSRRVKIGKNRKSQLFLKRRNNDFN